MTLTLDLSGYQDNLLTAETSAKFLQATLFRATWSQSPLFPRRWYAMFDYNEHQEEENFIDDKKPAVDAPQ